MKTLYFVIVSRPTGSSTWLPLGLAYDENPSGNFFASRDRALSFIEEKMPERHKERWMHSEGCKVPNQFKVAKVCL